MNNSLVKKTALYMQNALHHESSGHDWFHVERVWKIAKFIQKQEGGDLLVIELAALLHNLKDHNYPFATHETKADQALNGMLEMLEIEGDLKQKVIIAISDSKFKTYETNCPLNIEGKILQDANWLDALGALGVARAFAGGGRIDRPLYDPNIKIRRKISVTEYQKKYQTTSFNYLFEKSIRAAKLLHTKTARQVAVRRVQFLKSFMDEFLLEWNSQDIMNPKPLKKTG